MRVKPSRTGVKVPRRSSYQDFDIQEFGSPEDESPGTRH
jgi:hypothetical protein